MRLQEKWAGFGVVAAVVLAAAAWNITGVMGRQGPESGDRVLTALPRHDLRTASVGADHPPVLSPPRVDPETWSEAEVAAARDECTRLLAHTSDTIEISKPIRNGQCGTPAPVILKRATGVELRPPAVVNCRLAAKLHEWIKGSLQPVAEEVLGTSIKAITNASAYACRQRIGTSTNRISEHSLANALDISGFMTADGRSIAVITHWGPTARDRLAQAEVSKPAGGDARPLVDADPGLSGREALFLRRVHETACGKFGTVLGPEANEAHRDHLHLDLAARRHSSFCQ